ncbi:hypothetical protein DUNSADRAFT_16294 [Dunaliella salina]|uniref:Ubiquitinyl hydrolase 1 n=1 Tax=Dunaliella salina TaxID=3046 RepID=A0ABQ7G3W8_DUNSA|nr:hypothetical protein DUNSADRAFT_16294 [Dunaliella salina]|eukprot:KAF5829296.1 hypothetical protein DUNSADRAFT_16294 [Dunaliella salina]
MTGKDDEQRVIKLFEAAADAGINLSQRSLSWQTLASVLTKQQKQAGMLATVLVLVDKRRLPPNFRLCQRQPPSSMLLRHQRTQQQGEVHSTLPQQQGEEVQHSLHHPHHTQQQAQPVGSPPVPYCMRLGIEASTSSTPGRTGDYVGHYILLVEWDQAAQRFAVLDPDSPIAPLFLTPPELDHARKAFGTDEDVCVLSYPPSSLLLESALGHGASASSSPTAGGAAAKQQAQPNRVRQVAV